MRQLLPLALLIVLTGLLALSALDAAFLFAAAPILFVYLVWSVAAALSSGDPALAAVGAAGLTMHLSWAAGFIVSVGLHTLSVGIPVVRKPRPSAA
jgi:succinoglycan biosynthesis protein ExoA